MVDVDWLTDHLEDPDVRIVDARTTFDYQKGHVKNAINIQLLDIVRSRGGLPAMCASEKDIGALLGSKGIDNDATIVIYDNFGGLFSARLLWTLEHFGHKKVRVFDGSIRRWLAEGEEFETEVPSFPSAKFSTSHIEANLATKAWITENIKNPNVRFLDVRKEGEYSGKVAFGKRGGHIPGAVHIHWVDAIDPATGRFKPMRELREMYTTRGITPDKEIATYCWMGMRASHGYMILRLLGYPRVRNYDSSWSEWGDLDDCEVER
jgi:thiosulfate/3-mercaptopyruvate sulfurtransferase